MDLNNGQDALLLTQLFLVGVVATRLLADPPSDPGFVPCLTLGDFVRFFLAKPQPFGMIQRPELRLVISRT